MTFTPTASGARYAQVTLTDNAAGSPQAVNLTGTGSTTLSTVSLSATSLAFGNEPVTLTTASDAVTLTNTGSSALSISSITVTGSNAGDFTQTSTCGSSVAAGGNCTIVVLFTPSASGARTATISVADNASGSPQTISLSGTGTHDVILTWTGSTEGIAGYNVYRGTASGGESTTPLNSSPLPEPTYCDEAVQAGQEYYYVVEAVGSNGATQGPDSTRLPPRYRHPNP